MNERKTITLGMIVKSARMIAPVLHLGGRRAAARVINQLCAAVEQLLGALVHEQERAAALTQALQESVIAQSAAAEHERFQVAVIEYAIARRELTRLRNEADARMSEVSARASFHILTDDDRAWVESTRAGLRAAAERVTAADAALLALALAQKGDAR